MSPFMRNVCWGNTSCNTCRINTVCWITNRTNPAKKHNGSSAAVHFHTCVSFKFLIRTRCNLALASLPQSRQTWRLLTTAFMIEDLKLDENKSGRVHPRVWICLLPAEGRCLLNHRTAAAGTTHVKLSRLRLDKNLTNQNIGVEQIQQKSGTQSSSVLCRMLYRLVCAEKFDLLALWFFL